MFSNLEAKNKEIIVMAMEQRKYENEKTVIKQGEDGEELFIVFSGKLKCTKNSEEGKEETFLKTYEKGEVFGELALLYNAPRAANIYAQEDSVLFALDRDTFNNIVKNATIQKRDQYTQFLGKIDILSTLTTEEKDKICDCLQSQSYKKNDYVIKEGDLGKRFFLIQEGTAEALKNKNGKEEKVFDYKENEYFGELALLEGDKRQASIKVTSDTMTVVFLDKMSFKRLLGCIEDLLKRNKEKYSKYVSEN